MAITLQSHPCEVIMSFSFKATVESINDTDFIVLRLCPRLMRPDRRLLR
jgi:hypothetical protein